MLIFRYPAWRVRVQSVMYFMHTPSFTCRASCLTKNFRRQFFGLLTFRFSLLVFRQASWRFLARSVMYVIYTPSLARHASSLTKNFRR